MSGRTAGVAFAALALVLAASAQVAAPPAVSSGSLRVHVNLVNVPVNVTDGRGRPVDGLSRDDFMLTEDGHPETIRLFEPNATQPLSLVFAIDTSVSVRKDLPLARQAAYEFARSLLRPGDRLELLGFAGDVTEVVPFTGNLRSLDRGLRRLQGDGPTALYAAIARGASDLELYTGRKVIVVISDGSNSVPGVDYQQARTAALRAQTSIESLILVPIDADAGRDLGGEHALIQLSRDTGGQYFYIDASNPLQGAMAHLSLALRSEYLLGYYPASAEAGMESQPGGFRRIQVRMTKQPLNRAYHLDYRTGYYAQPAH